MSTNPYTDILETMGTVGAEKAREGALKFLLATVITVDPTRTMWQTTLLLSMARPTRT